MILYTKKEKEQLKQMVEQAKEKEKEDQENICIE